MKLRVDFERLDAIRIQMGAEESVWRLGSSALSERENLLIELETGIETSDLSDLISYDGLLTYKGEQVLLYIKDTYHPKELILGNPQDTRRFHVSDCDVLKNMRDKGRFERYVMTNRRDGIFRVNATDEFTRVVEEIEAPLLVCRVCLRNLNFKRYAESRHGAKKRIWESFELEDFFAEYATFFPYRPTHTDQSAPAAGYTQNWSTISQDRREAVDWTCQDCGVELEDSPQLLHCHHMNGNRGDNRSSNLKVLCQLCHSGQPNHQWMRVSSTAKATILRKRSEQGLG